MLGCGHLLPSRKDYLKNSINNENVNRDIKFIFRGNWKPFACNFSSLGVNQSLFHLMKLRVIVFSVNILELCTLHKSPLVFDGLVSKLCVCWLLKMMRFSFLAIHFFPFLFFFFPPLLFRPLLALPDVSAAHYCFPRFYPNILNINSCAWLCVFTSSIREAVKREVENNIKIRQVQLHSQFMSHHWA